ncbi:MAG: hypothetical protein DMF89_02135 [Acidobacteria bacterium]|nr:MAG: hypothetical protein DMF89_02135 [Acidobacteriota bacterium]
MTEAGALLSRGLTQRPLVRGLTRWSFLILVGIIFAGSIVSRIVRLPTNATGNKFRGAEDIERGDYESAIASFSRAIQLDRGDAEAYKSRGYAKNLTGDHKGALADYQTAIKLTPFDAGAYVGSGYTKDRLGDFEGAIADFDRALTFDPNDTEAYIDRGGTYDKLGDEDHAVEDLTRALQLDPKNGRAYLKRASLHFDQGRWQESIFGLRQGFERVPSGPARNGAQLLLWAARARAGDRRGADADLAAYAMTRSAEPDGRWAGSLAGFLTGEISEDALLAAAGESADAGRAPGKSATPEARTREAAERRCEALFYAAEKRLLAGDQAGALDRFRRSRAAGAPGPRALPISTRPRARRLRFASF